MTADSTPAPDRSPGSDRTASTVPADPATVSSGPPRLAVSDLGVEYGSTTVLQDITATVDAGEWLIVIGPNGAGKSSLLKAVAGVIPHRGTVSIGGAEPDSAEAPDGRTGSIRSKRIAYVPQLPVLPPGMTTAEYVLLGRTAHLGWFGAESNADRGRVAEILDRLTLGDLAARPVTELSGGESQRATLARALVQEADVLVLDEPTSALDLAHQVAVLELIDRLRIDDRLAVVTAMHDLGVASRFATSLLLIADGVGVVTGSVDEVLTEEILSRHYGTPVSVVDGPDGGRLVVPLRTKTSPRPGSAPADAVEAVPSPDQ